MRDGDGRDSPRPTPIYIHDYRKYVCMYSVEIMTTFERCECNREASITTAAAT